MFTVGKKEIGGDAPCFITFEAGPTHSGFDSAVRLIKLAAEKGADAIKFQITDPDRLVADRKLLFSYEILVDRETGRTEKVEEPLYDIMCRRVLSFDEYEKLKAVADSVDLAFFATVMFDEDLVLAEKLGFESLKIASADLNHLPFIRKAARTGLSIQLDTGNATIGEVEKAIDLIRREGNEKIIIHHCPSGYPAHLESINLNVIKTLGQMFPYPIAYSDHSPGWDIDVAAVAMGAKLIEKTITEDRMTPSVEHIMSLEPDTMEQFIKTIRDIETAMGVPRRLMSEAEMTKRNAVRRSVHAKRVIAAGEVISLDDVDFRRPGFGLTPDVFDEHLCGKKASRDISADELLSINDFLID